jgi:hypothetical protein
MKNQLGENGKSAQYKRKIRSVEMKISLSKMEKSAR